MVSASFVDLPEWTSLDEPYPLPRWNRRKSTLTLERFHELYSEKSLVFQKALMEQVFSFNPTITTWSASCTT